MEKFIKSDRSIAIFLIIYSFFVLGAGIWSSSVITQGDESDYIRSSNEMLRTGEFISPTLRGGLRFTKPPLLYWMIIVSHKIFGFSLFASRLPIVITGILTVFFVFRFGLLLFDRNAAIMASLLTCTSFGLIKFSRIALMDMPLTLLLLMSFYFFSLFYLRNRHHFLVLSGWTLGLSSLLKSPVYPAITVAIFIIFLLMNKSLGRLYSRYTLIAIVGGLLIALPWYFLMIFKHGSLFTEYYLKEHVGKFYVDKHYLFRVFTGLLLYLLPWTFIFISALFRVFKERLFSEWQYRLLFISIMAFLLVFMLPNQKGHYYAIPLLPYCGLITGGIISRVSGFGKIPKILTASVLVATILILAAGGFLLQNAGLAPFVITITVLGLSISAIVKGKINLAILTYGLVMVPFYALILPVVNIEPIPAEQALSLLNQTPVFTYRLSPVNFSDSLGMDITEIKDERKLKELAVKRDNVIISENEFLKLNEETSHKLNVLLTWKKWRHRIPLKEVYDAIAENRLEHLQENFFLIKGVDRNSKK